MAVLQILVAALERHEDGLGLQAIHRVVARVGEEGVVPVRIDVRCGGARLAHREADQLPVRIESLATERLLVQGSSSRRSAGSAVTRISPLHASLLEDPLRHAVPHRDGRASHECVPDQIARLGKL